MAKKNNKSFRPASMKALDNPDDLMAIVRGWESQTSATLHERLMRIVQGKNLSVKLGWTEQYGYSVGLTHTEFNSYFIVNHKYLDKALHEAMYYIENDGVDFEDAENEGNIRSW